MIRQFICAAMITLIGLSGCSGDKKAAELLETAQFEEKQNNLEHASKLYETIIKKHPGTPAADKARSQLLELKARQSR
ncbi:MAG TPA: hypothetical protein PLN25_11130 [Deltaproteobacteria bacterium]|mgnify:FL=1|nr:hypothetical protein [Deltaproteobacteria bacterium]HQB37658.1 hypothetical protein [Deltaproteobacteria bacterium]